MLYCCDIVVRTCYLESKRGNRNSKQRFTPFTTISQPCTFLCTAKEDYNVYPEATLGGIRCARCLLQQSSPAIHPDLE